MGYLRIGDTTIDMGTLVLIAAIIVAVLLAWNIWRGFNK